MKKLIIALVLGLLFVAALATTALADNGPHGGFNGSTEACASCHRAHSAISADGFLLVASDVYTLCTNCHDGTGAFTNVVDGFYDTQPGSADKATWAGGWGDAGLGLFGGGFVNTRMLTDFGNASNEGGLANATTNTGANQNLSATSWARMNAYDTNSTAPAARAATSTHTVAGLGASVGTGTVWGSGNFQASAVSPFGAGTFSVANGNELECTSCHNPHGNAGKQWGSATGAPYPSYRLLDFTPVGSGGFEVASEVAATSSAYWNTAQVWGAAPGGVNVAYATKTVIPSTAGVMVPDTITKWYSVNNDVALDGTLMAYRGRAGSGEIYTANFAGQGDYMGRYYGYKRPSATVTAVTTGTLISCGNPPTTPGTACGATTGTAFNNLAPHDALGYWCATCHDRYLAPGGASRTTDSGDPGYHFRHRSAASGATLNGTGTYTCVDCHNAHGTSATANPLATSSTYAASSALLKADNRAVCIRCHAGAVNFFNVVTSPTAPMVYPP